MDTLREPAGNLGWHGTLSAAHFRAGAVPLSGSALDPAGRGRIEGDTDDEAAHGARRVYDPSGNALGMVCGPDFDSSQRGNIAP